MQSDVDKKYQEETELLIFRLVFIYFEKDSPIISYSKLIDDKMSKKNQRYAGNA